MPEEVQSTEPQESPKETPVKISHKINWFHIVIGVIAGVILLGMGFGVYLLTQSKSATTGEPIKVSTPSAKQATPSATATPSAKKDETAGWKTYKDSNLGITFKYPVGWSVSSSNKTSLNLSTTNPANWDMDKYGEVIILSADHKTEVNNPSGVESTTKGIQIKLITWKNNIEYTDPNDAVGFELSEGDKKTNPKIGGNEAVRIDLKNSPATTEISILVGNKIIRVIRFDGDDPSKYDDKFDQILSTFKFLPSQ